MKIIFEKNIISSEITDNSISIIRDGGSLISASAVERNGQAHKIHPHHQENVLNSGVTVKHRLNYHAPDWEELLQECSSIFENRLKFESLSCFISPGGGHTPLHYDKSSVLVIQLCGSKRVGVQNSPAEIAPTADFLLADQSQQMDTWYQLQKGDLVYIPPGFVHTTYTDELSYTLGVGFEELVDIAQ